MRFVVGGVLQLPLFAQQCCANYARLAHRSIYFDSNFDDDRSLGGWMDGWMDGERERWWKEWGAERAHCLSRNAEGRLFHRATLSPPLNSRINNRRRVFASHFFRENNALDKERNLLLLPSTVSYKFL